MALLTYGSDLNKIKDAEEKFRYIEIALKQLSDVVNGRVEILKNLVHNVVEVTFEDHTNTLVEHGLGFVPNGYIVVGATEDEMSLYDGIPTFPAPTATTINLASTGTGTARILFF